MTLLSFNFEEIFHDMIYILHFICDVKLFKENNPDKLFIYEVGKKGSDDGKDKKGIGW
jgi:hypothetical protein